MADKKIKKITASDKKTVTNSMADLRKLSAQELQQKLQTIRADLLAAQKSLRANELVNPRVIRRTKKEIARIMTVIAEMSSSRPNDNVSTDVIARSETTKQSSNKPGSPRSARDDKGKKTVKGVK
ncbi:50S ribosomal protein L29 [Candidatus Saccharibacteria bacterium]|nr:50S ribosomal protein L29 [Candidatus Saccharibacteria bacterium]